MHSSNIKKISKLDKELPIYDLEMIDSHNNSQNQNSKNYDNSTTFYCIIFGCQLIISLYPGFSQGIQLQLAKQGVKLTKISYFALITNILVLKIIIVPFVDKIYNVSFGKHKTYLIPSQFLLGANFLAMGLFDIQEKLRLNHIVPIILYIFFMEIVSVILDMANNFLVSRYISEKYLPKATSVQKTGDALSFFYGSIFMVDATTISFKQSIYPNATDSFINLNNFCLFTGAIIILYSLISYFIIQEENEPRDQECSVREIYVDIIKKMMNIRKNNNIKFFILFVICKDIGIQLCVAAFGFNNIQLIQIGGFPVYSVNSYSVISFPFQLLVALFVSKYLTTDRYPKFFIFSISSQLLKAILTIILLQNLEVLGNYNYRSLSMAVALEVLNKMNDTFISITIGGFIFRICDKKIGVTLLYFLLCIKQLGNHVNIDIIKKKFSLFIAVNLIGHFQYIYCAGFGVLWTIVFLIIIWKPINKSTFIQLDSWKIDL